MLNTRHFYVCVCSLALVAMLAKPTLADNCYSTVNTFPATFSRVQYAFQCYPSTGSNPAIPSSYISSATSYNELKLSPNFYTQVPTAQICSFTNLYSLDLSNNQLTSLSGVFKTLTCLTGLTTIDFSNNLVGGVLSATDFPDKVQYVSLNLSVNFITAVRTAAFFSPDGTSRFPSLRYLGLAYNKLVTLDLLAFLSLPQASLFVDMNTNKLMGTLVNELSMSFADSRLLAFTGGRSLDATNNNLQILDDTNLLQYGLTSAADFRAFLLKLLNYNLKQSNQVRTFLCYCQYSLYTVPWYRSFASSLTTAGYPIFQLFCSTFPQTYYVFDFDISGCSNVIEPSKERAPFFKAYLCNNYFVLFFL